MKTRQNNNVTDHTGTIYVENKTELAWLIELGAIYHENPTG